MASIEGFDNSLRSLRPYDLETASVRSAAPSYVSEAPSYHTTVSSSESTPPLYSPPAAAAANNNNNSNNNNNNDNNSNNHNAAPTPRLLAAAAPAAAPAPASAEEEASPIGTGPRSTLALPTLLPSNTAHLATPGLPPIPSAPHQHPGVGGGGVPSIGAFSIPSWSAVNTNPIYQRVATRRAQAAMSRSGGEGLLRNAVRALERVSEEPGPGAAGAGAGVVRPLEDPYLVGEVAAARARRARLAREDGDHVLQREDKRWDWFLAQQIDEERERSWKQFRSSMGSSSSPTGPTRGRLARRFTAGGR